MINDALLAKFLDGQATKEEVDEINKALASNSQTAEELRDLSLLETALLEGRAPLRSHSKPDTLTHARSRRSTNLQMRRAVVVAAMVVVLGAIVQIFQRVTEVETEPEIARTEQITLGKSLTSASNSTSTTGASKKPNPDLEKWISTFYVSDKDIGEELLIRRPSLAEIMGRLVAIYENPEFGGGDLAAPKMEFEIDGGPGYRLPLSAADVVAIPKFASIERVARFYGAVFGYQMDIDGNMLRFTTREVPDAAVDFMYAEVRKKDRGARVWDGGRKRSGRAVVWRDSKFPEFGENILFSSDRFFENILQVNPSEPGYLVEPEEERQAVISGDDFYVTKSDAKLLREIYGGMQIYIKTEIVSLPLGADIHPEVTDQMSATEYWNSRGISGKVDVMETTSLVASNDQYADIAVTKGLLLPRADDQGYQWTGVKIGYLTTVTGSRITLIADVDIRELHSAGDSPSKKDGINITTASVMAFLNSGSTVVIPAGDGSGGRQLGLRISATTIDKSGQRVNAPKSTR